MIIQTVHVRNFRSIRNEVLVCKPLTALVGRNGVGKSAFLNAIDLFYSTSEKVNEEDFHNCDTSKDIVVVITFIRLSDRALELFRDRVRDDALTIKKIVRWNEGRVKSAYHGTTLQNPDFQEIREGFKKKDRAVTAKAAFGRLCENENYKDLPKWSTIDGTKKTLVEWEKAHPEACKQTQDDGQFFGFKQVAEGYLGRFTRCLFIPAVRDATSDAIEGRGSVLSDLMDLVVRNVLANKKELQELTQKIKEEYEKIMAPENISELGDLATQLSSTLRTFVPNTEIQLSWLSVEGLDLPVPRADMKLVEDGYSSPVDRCGHGLQRAFVLTMLQHLALAQLNEGGSTEEGSEDESQIEDELPSLVLLLEEPELYQHPNRQRHFARILLDLSSGTTPGVTDRTQVIYSTHSPHFVGLDRIENIRLLKKIETKPKLPKETRVVQTTLDTVADRIWHARGKIGERFTGNTLIPRLTSIMTPWMSEGFFADTVVLVEGGDDRAAILGMATVMSIDLESIGISVIPCGGKTNLDRPIAIFQELGICVYAVWDSDKGKKDPKPADNHTLQRLFDVDDVEDWPSVIGEKYSCFEIDLENALEQDIGEEFYATSLQICQEKFAIPKKKHAVKNPYVVAELLSMAEKTGRNCKALREIVQNIIIINESGT